jgi:hypothetical protein
MVLIFGGDKKHGIPINLPKDSPEVALLFDILQFERGARPSIAVPGE